MDRIDSVEVQEISIPGLYYIPDIKENTDNILSELDKREWIPVTTSKKSRLVQQYGYKYNYNNGNISEKTEEIPDFIKPLQNVLSYICKELNLIDEQTDFNQCLINNYEIGQGISAHIDDKKFGPVIGCFTFHSGATMRFKHNNESYDWYVEPNSLYIMSSDARYKWTHEMTTKKYDTNNKIKRDRRISITFRHV
jgi:alkylated DNA repair dioxygenase AlkB